MTAEQWLPIPGFEGRYEVSNLGRVRSRTRVLKPSAGSTGYPHVSLPDSSARSGFRVHYVHALVTLAFLGPRPEGQQVRHGDGDRTHCALANLSYGTPVENEADKKRHGTHEKTRRTHCPLDHRLAPPNLVVGALKRGHRNCLACSRARANVRHAASRGVTVDLKTEADRHYRAITSA